ncbi:MAG: hypothetical protein Q8M56_12895 [Desulfobacterales bacterium]|nr:hypothetical protein [Desulfobacterales bacterium]
MFFLANGLHRKLNYSVSCISSGEEAIAYLKDHQVDLMVLGMIIYPGMAGLGTYRSVFEIRPEHRVRLFGDRV